MTTPRWDITKIVPVARDLVSFGLGAVWGDYLIHQPAGETEPWAWVLAAAMLNLPLVTWADRLRLQQRGESAPSANGTDPADRETTVP